MKPRIIATTDGEVDDRSTMIRFLMYSTDYDVAGIIQVNSKFQKSGHSGEKWIERELDLYDSVLPNLRKHHPGYPDAAKLRAVVRVGNENKDDLTSTPPNFATKDTPGSQLIIDTLLDSDPRPVHVPSWGGANTTAYALWKLKTEYPKEKFDYAVSKIRIYCIWYQDSGGKWIEDNIPGALIYEAYGWDDVWDYQSVSGVSPANVKAYMTGDWLNANVKKNHGALGAYYPQSFISEGDTPAFLFLIDNGLDCDRDYTLGGWGGRPRFDAGQHLTDGLDDGNKNKPFWRWVPTLQNDFAARMDWSVANSYSAANHNPEVQVAGERHRRVSPGEVVNLDGSSTTDPDGDQLTYKWWQYGDADSVAGTISINDSSLSKASFVAPNESGKQVHIIFEATDDGTPPLTRYQRVLFDVN